MLLLSPATSIFNLFEEVATPLPYSAFAAAEIKARARAGERGRRDEIVVAIAVVHRSLSFSLSLWAPLRNEIERADERGEEARVCESSDLANAPLAFSS